MSEFVKNLLLRGAGLAPVVAPRLAPAVLEEGPEVAASEIEAPPEPVAEVQPGVPSASLVSSAPRRSAEPAHPRAAPAVPPVLHPPATGQVVPSPAARVAAAPPVAPVGRRMERPPARVPPPEISHAEPRSPAPPVPPPVMPRAGPPASAVESPAAPPQATAAPPVPAPLATPPGLPPALSVPPRHEPPRPAGEEPAWVGPQLVAPAPAALPQAHQAGEPSRVPRQEPSVQVRIGRVEIRQEAPSPVSPRRQPRGFSAERLARSYLDRRWY